MMTLTKIDTVLRLAGPILGLLLGYWFGRWQAAARMNELRLAALRMDGRGIAGELPCGEHRLSGGFAQRARGIMVKIYAH